MQLEVAEREVFGDESSTTQLAEVVVAALSRR